MGNMVLLICSVSVVLYSAGSGVKSVVVVLDTLRVSLFCLVQSYISVGMAGLVVVLCVGLCVLIECLYHLRRLLL